MSPLWLPHGTDGPGRRQQAAAVLWAGRSRRDKTARQPTHERDMNDISILARGGARRRDKTAR